jgi:hypothetical protein
VLIYELPREFESPEELGAEITNGLSEGLNYYENPTPQTWRLLDKRILAETETLGWRMFYSPLVQMRHRAWETEPNGVENCEKFAAALVKCNRIMRRLIKPPLDPKLHSHKRENLKELRLAFKLLGQRVRAARRKPASKQLRFWFEEILSTGDFPFLRVNLDSWLSFFSTETGFVQSTLNVSRFPAAALYDRWLATSMGYEPETLRQKIALLKL